MALFVFQGIVNEVHVRHFFCLYASIYLTSVSASDRFKIHRAFDRLDCWRKYSC